MNKKTNTALVKEMMSFSDHGVLKEVFILEAIYKYSQLTLEDTSKWGDDSLISQDAWRTCAQECIKAISERNSK